MSKRYVLLVADGELSDSDRRDLASELQDKYGKVTVITAETDPRAVIVKTTNSVAPLLRAASGEFHPGGRHLAAVLTSGSIGKLKRRASGAPTTRNGEVSE